MIKRLLSVFFLCVTGSVFALGEGDSLSSSFGSSEPQEILVNNRVLVKIDGKAISLVDVVHKMDYLFYRQFPHLASSLMARYQFYTINWRHMLSSVLDDHLIMQDAKEKKVDEEIKDGDIRETMEELFGPEVVISLDKMGLSYDEAWELVKTDLTVQQMNQMMVRSRAQHEVSPKRVKKHYDSVIKEQPVEDKWVYQTLTIESKDEEKGKTVAEKALALLSEEKKTLAELPAVLGQGDEEIVIRISEEFSRKEKELSPAHKAILQTLAVGTHSAPVLQSSKKDGVMAYRIFYLKESEKGKQVPLQELEAKISQEILSKAMARHGDAYVQKLRKHYGITEAYLKAMIPENFEPFVLR